MKRVVVTGIGLITSLGTGKEKTWENIIAGKTGIKKIKSFSTENFKVKIAGEINDFEPSDFGIEKKDLKKLARFTQFGIGASKMALEDSGYKITDKNAEKIGVIVSSGIGGIEVFEKQYKNLLEKGPRKVSPFAIPAIIENMVAGNISIYTGAKGASKSIVTACAAGTQSIGEAFRMLRLGELEAILAGGSEASITPFGIAGFSSMKALSTRNEEPEKASRPFTSDRDGFVMGEGAGVLLLETLESAKSRNARIYAEIIGYGETSDAYHMTAPVEGAEGDVRAMKIAISQANIRPQEVDYINAHGTSTPVNDVNETTAIKTVFGDHAYDLLVSSTKGATGHTLGGAGGIEAGLLAIAIKKEVIPPTVNQDNFDIECDLNYVANKSIKKEIKIGLSNSMGFGGHNAAIIMKKYSK